MPTVMTPLRAMTRFSSRKPVETLVVGFSIVSLAYFQLLHAVRHSEFLRQPTLGAAGDEPGSFAASASHHHGHGGSEEEYSTLRRDAQGRWSEITGASAGAATPEKTIYLNRIVVSLDVDLILHEEERNTLVYPAHTSAPVILSEDSAFPSSASARSRAWSSSEEANLLDEDARSSLGEFESSILRKQVDGYCFRPTPDADCFVVSFDPAVDPAKQSRSAVLAVGLESSADVPEWIQSLVSSYPSTDSRGFSYVPLSSLYAKRSDGLGLSLKPFPPSYTKGLLADSQDLSSVKWVLYAGKAFVLRFWGLAKKADSADIFVMLLGYILMHLTFISLFMNMRKLGSKFWLGCSVLVYGAFGFLCSLLTAYLCGITINPIILSEALPFLIITVGFEKPFVLARAIFTNPALTPVSSGPPFLRSRNPSSARLYPSSSTTSRVLAFGPAGSEHQDDSVSSFRSGGVRWGTPVPAKDIVNAGYDKTGRQIIRDYAIEIAVLVAGSFTGVSGLKEFCQLAAIILFFDCLFLFGFFASVLTVMVEVRRIRIMRGLRRVDSSADLAHILDDGTTPDPLTVAEPTEATNFVQKLQRLVLGSSTENTTESPTQRLKLLLITAFLVLHALNLCTTLTAKTALRRHSTTTSSASAMQTAAIATYNEFLRTDPNDSTLTPILDKLSALLPRGTDITVQVPPPTFFRLVLPSQPVLGDHVNRGFAIVTEKNRVASSMAILDRFMSGWTKLVGDPVLSKWIVIVLIVSVFLNGYLLKGIAIGDQGTGQGFVPSSAPEAATRLLLGTSADNEKEKKLKRRWSGGIEGLSRLQTEWTLADAAEMAKERRQELIADEKERDRAMNGVSKQEQAKQQKHRRPSASNDSSDDSPPGSPLFLTTKPKSRTPHARGRLVGTNEASNEILHNGLPLPEVITPTSHTNGHIHMPHSASETSSETAPDTPATTVADETERADQTPRHAEPVVTAPAGVRPLEELVIIFAAGKGALLVNDEEVILLVQKGKIAAYALEKLLKDNLRAVKIRRALISRASTTKSLESSLLPYLHYDYSKVMGQCCENVVGFTPVPVGIAGPLRIDGVALPIPMATTEGALVASTSRGCKALNAGGGVTTVVVQDAMTRGPALEFPNVTQCAAAKMWIDSEEGSNIMKASFNSTSRFARLQHLKANMAGRTLYVRFATQTGDAMGMNMISKGTERALETMMTDHFPEMRVASLSGNFCIDKKPSAINWINGRGKSVVAEAVVPGHIVTTILKTSVAEICRLNVTKNLVGSALAGSIGGNNAHAANILAAIFLATGQDPAQVVESSNCMTLMEPVNDGKDLLISCTMPCIEVGTIGGGTILPPQQAMLEMLGVNGPHPTQPGENARRLARAICAACIAGELSLMSALAQGTLVQSHMALNRSAPATPATVPITGHSYLTPAPTRPATPSLGQGRQNSSLHLMTPMPTPPRH